MKRFSTLLPALGLLSVLAACGGQEAAMDDMDMDAAPEGVAAEAATPGGLSCYLAGATPTEAAARVSPHTTLSFNLGANPALLCYGAPSARGREIMGGLVPYGVPWRIGADEPTTLHLSARANLGGVALEPGSYSLYAIPGQNEWQFFINTNWQRWGIEIDAAVRSTEIGSFTVVPQPLPEMVEQLTYEFEEAAGGEPGGEILLEWANTLLRIPIEG
ncbi:MAG: DUF2911 domain-containing protein [Longimicrobiales bacterium]